LLIIVLLAPLAAALLSTLLLWRYRRAVLGAMASRKQRLVALPDLGSPRRREVPGTGLAPDSRLRSTIRVRRIAAALAHAVGGVAFAVILAASYIVSGGAALSPWRLFVVGLVFAWPLVLALLLVLGPTGRAAAGSVAGYLLFYFAAGMYAGTSDPAENFVQSARLWLLLNGPVSLLFLGFLSRRLRAVGPLALSFCLLALAGTIPLVLLSRSEAFLRLLVKLAELTGLSALWAVGGAVISAVVILTLLAGWPFLRLIGKLYVTKRLSDQTLLVDSLWLYYGMIVSIMMLGSDLLWGLAGPAAFLTFALLRAAGFRVLRRPKPQGPTLLLLRVFRAAKQRERLFDLLSARWRYLGSIQLLAGPDLATTTIEPHEVLDYLGRRLEQRFVKDSETLASRLHERDFARDPDGRYRVNEFFCSEDTWRETFLTLARDSDVAVMDLRGFSRNNAGSAYELQQLVAVVPLGRIVLLVDEATIEPDVRAILKTPIPLIKFPDASAARVTELMRAVCGAASPELRAPAT
jgi:hypothetical protein